MRASPSLRRPIPPALAPAARRLRAIRHLVLGAAALAGANAAQAGLDDLGMGAATAAPQGGGMLAAGKRLLDTVIASERNVVEAVRQNAADASAPSAWQLGLAGGDDSRGTDLAARAAALARAAGDPVQRAIGLADGSLGARLRVLRGDADTHVPCVSWMAALQPGTNPGNALRPSVRVSAEWALAEDFSFGVMPGVAFDVDPQGRRLTSGTFALTVGKAWTPRWRTYIDLARDRFSASDRGGIATMLNLGASLNLTPATRVDLAITHGLGLYAPEIQAGVGVSSAF